MSKSWVVEAWMVDRMRLTVEDAKKHGLLGRIKVKVDGQYVRGITIADEEQGYVECYKYKDGKLVLSRHSDDVEREIIKGHVEIEITNETPKTTDQAADNHTEET